MKTLNIVESLNIREVPYVGQNLYSFGVRHDIGEVHTRERGREEALAIGLEHIPMPIQHYVKYRRLDSLNPYPQDAVEEDLYFVLSPEVYKYIKRPIKELEGRLEEEKDRSHKLRDNVEVLNLQLMDMRELLVDKQNKIKAYQNLSIWGRLVFLFNPSKYGGNHD